MISRWKTRHVSRMCDSTANAFSLSEDQCSIQLSYGREWDKSALLTFWTYPLKSVYTRLYTRYSEILRQPPCQNQFQNCGHQEELKNDSKFTPFRSVLTSGSIHSIQLRIVRV